MTPELVESAVLEIDRSSDDELDALLDTFLWSAWPTQVAQNQ